MGICSSCEALAVVPQSTAKLILINGELKEFDRPVKISTVVENKSEFFICDADDMEFDEYLTEAGSNEEMRTGQIYFMLPRTMLKRRMHAEDLAALAIKASKALSPLMKGTPLVFGVGSRSEGVKNNNSRSNRGRSGRGRNFVVELSAIQE